MPSGAKPCGKFVYVGKKLNPVVVLVWFGEASARLCSNVEPIAQALIAVPVAHADESGLR